MGLNSFINKLENVKDYGIFLIQKSWDERKGELRFNQLSPEVVKSLLTKENIDTISAQVNQRNLARIKDSIDPSIIPAKNKKNVDDAQWIKEHHLPEKLLQNPKALAFIRDSKIYSHMRYYQHAIQTQDSKLGLIVDGDIMNLEEILEKFTLRKAGADFIIIEKATNKQYYYLEMGLMEHDPQKEIKPTRSLTPEETPSQYKVVFYGIKEGHTNSAGGIKRWDRHTLIEVKTPNSELYTFGALSQGGITCPDHYSYIPKKHVEVEFTISESQYSDLLQMVAQEQKENNSFNILFRNCSSFGGRIA